MLRDSEGTHRSRGGGRIFAFFVGLTILLVGGMAAFYYFVAQPTTSPIKRFADALGSITEQKVTISGESVVLEKAETRELAVVRRKTQTVVKYESKWLKSDKLLIVKGNFLVKAGFDLTGSEGFEMRGNEVVGTWPEAKVLSVEMVDYEIYFSQSGMVNKLTGEDYEAAVNVLKNQARYDAEQKSDIKDEAERIIRQRLEDLSGTKVTLEPETEKTPEKKK